VKSPISAGIFPNPGGTTDKTFALSRKAQGVFVVKGIPPAMPVVLKSFSYARKKYPPLVK
jgi:hypothetical protein